MQMREMNIQNFVHRLLLGSQTLKRMYQSDALTVTNYNRLYIIIVIKL